MVVVVDGRRRIWGSTRRLRAGKQLEHDNQEEGEEEEEEDMPVMQAGDETHPAMAIRTRRYPSLSSLRRVERGRRRVSGEGQTRA
eukprot:382439-Hanusia_phi.AAC.1